jgi:hypothetical protein
MRLETLFRPLLTTLDRGIKHGPWNRKVSVLKKVSVLDLIRERLR